MRRYLRCGSSGVFTTVRDDFVHCDGVSVRRKPSAQLADGGIFVLDVEGAVQLVGFPLVAANHIYATFRGNSYNATHSTHIQMSIDRKTFEQSSTEELEGLSTTTHVLGFLAANDDAAFKAREIARRTDLDEGAVSTALTRLKDRGLVEHKGPYWAITTDEERLADYDGYARATALFNEQLGTEDRTAWRTHAPNERHPSRTGADE